MLSTGERLGVEEFLRRWEELPDLKLVELIEGVVHVAPPVTLEHAQIWGRMVWWMGSYGLATSGCECGSKATWLMLGSVPQPDVYLRISPACGGQRAVWRGRA